MDWCAWMEFWGQMLSVQITVRDEKKMQGFLSILLHKFAACVYNVAIIHNAKTSKVKCNICLEGDGRKIKRA